MGDVIQFKPKKKQEKQEFNSPNMRNNEGFDDRVSRIKASLAKINALMEELKKTSDKAKDV